jgi:hypothetical protein
MRMTDGNFPRRQIDEAIDRAVREMMQVDPRPGLRRRVLARLERRSRVRFRGSFFLLPAAAVIAIILAIVLPAMRQASPEVTTATPVQSASNTPRELPSAPAPPAPAAAATRPVRPPAVPARTVSIFGDRRDRVSASSVPPVVADAGATSAPAAAEDVSPGLPRIVMTPLVEVSEIRVRPIEIQAITLPALPPRR